MKTILFLEVKNLEKVLYKGPVKSLTSFNKVGPFDILPYHANFFSIIKNKILINDQAGERKELSIKDRGVLQVMDNQITIFLGIETVGADRK